MADPAWSSSPPEVNHLRLVGAGAAGTATTLAAATAWQALFGCHEVGFSLSALNTAATALNFEGAGGGSSAATATGLNSALQLLAGWVEEKVPIVTSAVEAYETAVSAMIPAAVSIANRAEQAADVALNPVVFGALTPAIVALDSEYFGEHWPHNAAAGIAYGAALTGLAAALTVPPPLAAPGASPAAPATAAAAVAETAGQVAAGEAMKESSHAANAVADGAEAPVEAGAAVGQIGSMMSAPAQAAMGALQPAMGMFQAPLSALPGLGGVVQGMGGALSPATAAPPDDDEIPAAVGSDALGSDAAWTEVAGQPVAPVAGCAGAGAAGPVGVSSAPLTSYVRPSDGAATENAGRPVGLRAGMLGIAPVAPGSTVSMGGPLPLSGAQGMLSAGTRDDRREEPTHARIMLGNSPIHPSSTG